MKAKKKTTAPVRREITDDEIRDYAQHLYEQSGRQPGHDLDHWFEAKACLEANIPKAQSHTRLHRQRKSASPGAVAFIGITTTDEAPADETGEVGVVLEEVVLLENTSRR